MLPSDPDGFDFEPPRPSAMMSPSVARLLVLSGAPALPSSHRRPPTLPPEAEPSLEWSRSVGFYMPLEAEAVLEALLLEPTGIIANTLCKAMPVQDEFLPAMLEFFEAHSKGFDLTVAEVVREVKATAEIHLLFRGRSVASRFITHYMRLASEEYISRLVNWVSAEIRALPQPLEIDPNAPGGASVEGREASLEALRQLSGALLERLVRGPTPPVQLRRMAYEFISAVQARWPSVADAAQVALGALFFLRVLCPAIATASADMASTERRALTLLSKVLQQDANGVPFSEAFMTPLTPLIALHRPLLAALVHTLPLPPPPPPLPHAPAPLHVPPARRSLNILAERLATMIDQLLPQMITPPVRASRPIAYAALSRLSYLLSVYKPPISNGAPVPMQIHAPIPVPSPAASGIPTSASSSPALSSSPPSSPTPERTDTPPRKDGGSKRGASGLAKSLTSGLVAIGRSGRLVLRLGRDGNSTNTNTNTPASTNTNTTATSNTSSNSNTAGAASGPTPTQASNGSGSSSALVSVVTAPPRDVPTLVLSSLATLLTNKHVAATLLSVAAQHGRTSGLVRPLVELAGAEHAPPFIRRLLKSGRPVLATTALRALVSSSPAWRDYLRTSFSSVLTAIVLNLGSTEKQVAADAEKLDLENFATSALLHDAAQLFGVMAQVLARAPPSLWALVAAQRAARGDGSRVGNRSNDPEEASSAEFVFDGVFVAAIAAPDEWGLLRPGAVLGRVTRTLLELMAKMLLLAAIGSAFRAPNTALIDHFLHNEGAVLRAALHKCIVAAPAPGNANATNKDLSADLAVNHSALACVAAFANEHRSELAPMQLLESPARPLQHWLCLLFANAPVEPP